MINHFNYFETSISNWLWVYETMTVVILGMSANKNVSNKYKHVIHQCVDTLIIDLRHNTLRWGRQPRNRNTTKIPEWVTFSNARFE